MRSAKPMSPYVSDGGYSSCPLLPGHDILKALGSTHCVVSGQR